MFAVIIRKLIWYRLKTKRLSRRHRTERWYTGPFVIRNRSAGLAFSLLSVTAVSTKSARNKRFPAASCEKVSSLPIDDVIVFN